MGCGASKKGGPNEAKGGASAGGAPAKGNEKDNKASTGSAISNPGKITEFYNLDKKKLGEGSYGSVCKAQKRQNQGGQSDQEYAVKTIQKDKDKKNEMRTNAEIRIMLEMAHPNIIKLYESFEDNRAYYLVMELCTGGELFDRIIEAGHFTEAVTGHIMKQIFEALNYMHTIKMIAHRDLKPENFLLLSKDKIDAKGNHLKIIDYEEFLASTIEKRVKLEDAVLSEAFRVFDSNGEGQISRQELKKVGQQLEGGAVYFDMTRMDELMKADTDGNDKISFEEFKKVMVDVK